ncbi:Uma2 family endonuclease [Kovacikia minuta CCNUW1]|uniref:Uma2 family endonuclease n=1 Tax=Kovacikia minuta TaxID=2931930 RepID=UPI001CCD0DBF|nr:Uma2 family endonuclease [Kovacikia minuta]UBF26094.1 Uma2 family endonuclease [Kovacikia minuta CCNUW1]
MTATPTKPITLEEYLTYDDGTDARYELVDGVLVEMPTESPLNILIARFLLVHFVQMGIPIERVGNKQQIAVKSPKVTVREPDLMIHSEASAAAILTQKQALLNLDMPAPILVIEVVSPGDPGSQNYDRDYVDKRNEYAARGIHEYWIVDPDRQMVLVLTLAANQYQETQFTGTQSIHSPLFPNLNLSVEQLLKAGR